MGLLRRLFSKESEENRTLQAVEYCSGDFHQAIVGESHYQDELKRIAGKARADKRVEFRVLLMPEPDNKYDPNAVAVYAEGGGIIGYLARDVAEEYQPIISGHLEVRKSYPCCMAVLYGGTDDKPSIGVWLDIDWDELEDA